MTTDFQLLERVVHVAPFGVRFRDAVTGQQVTSGLSVEAYPLEAALGRARPEDEVFGRRRAFANRSGTQVLIGAPGMRSFELSFDGEEEWDATPPGAAQFVFEVEDKAGRYLPFSFEARLPHRGLFVWEENPLPPESPPWPSDGMPLFSAPARVSPAGMAAVRAELWDETAATPAAHAVLEARFKGRLLGRGVADEEGRVALIFPYPPPARLPQSSPPYSPSLGSIPPLTQQQWSIDLSARYGPVGSPPPYQPRFPDLLTVLSQGPATLWRGAAQTEPLTAVTLGYGRECFICTESASPVSSPVEGAPRDALFVTPAA